MFSIAMAVIWLILATFTLYDERGKDEQSVKYWALIILLNIWIATTVIISERA